MLKDETNHDLDDKKKDILELNEIEEKLINVLKQTSQITSIINYIDHTNEEKKIQEEKLKQSIIKQHDLLMTIEKSLHHHIDLAPQFIKSNKKQYIKHLKQQLDEKNIENINKMQIDE